MAIGVSLAKSIRQESDNLCNRIRIAQGVGGVVDRFYILEAHKMKVLVSDHGGLRPSPIRSVHQGPGGAGQVSSRGGNPRASATKLE